MEIRLGFLIHSRYGCSYSHICIEETSMKEQKIGPLFSKEKKSILGIATLNKVDRNSDEKYTLQRKERAMEKRLCLVYLQRDWPFYKKKRIWSTGNKATENLTQSAREKEEKGRWSKSGKRKEIGQYCIRRFFEFGEEAIGRGPNISFGLSHEAYPSLIWNFVTFFPSFASFQKPNKSNDS